MTKAAYNARAPKPGDEADSMGHSKNLMEEIIVMESHREKLGKVHTIEDAQLYRPQACSAHQGFKAPIRAGFADVRSAPRAVGVATKLAQNIRSQPSKFHQTVEAAYLFHAVVAHHM